MEFLCIFHFLLWPLSYLGAAPAWGFSMDTGTCHRGGSARCSAVPRAGLLVFGCSSGGVHVCRCGSVRGPSRSAFRVQPQCCHCAAPWFFTTGVRLWTNKLVLEYFHTEMLNGKNKNKKNNNKLRGAKRRHLNITPKILEHVLTQWGKGPCDQTSTFSTEK